jgi:hypothetical protein
MADIRLYTVVEGSDDDKWDSRQSEVINSWHELLSYQSENERSRFRYFVVEPDGDGTWYIHARLADKETTEA